MNRIVLRRRSEVPRVVIEIRPRNRLTLLSQQSIFEPVHEDVVVALSEGRESTGTGDTVRARGP